MQTQISPDLTISYERVGQGNPLVFLHAFPLSKAMWREQIAHFSPNFDVLAPDSRGIGESSTFSGSPSVETLADDLALWLDAIGIEKKVILCGLSLGGYIALEFARKHDHRLGALVLADTRPDADTEEAKDARNEMIAFATASDGKAVGTRMLPRLLGETTRAELLKVVSLVEEISSSNSGRALAALVTAMRDRRDLTPQLGQIKVPTLVLGGNEDSVTTPEIMEKMARQIPGSRYETIEGAGHLSNLEQPERFNQILSEFLRGLPK